MDKSNKSTARNAIKMGDSEQLAKLLKRSNPNKADKMGETLLHTACHHQRVKIEMIRLILQSGGDPNIKNNTGKTPLHYLCQNEESNYESIKLLIEYGADPNFKDYYGFTPFDRLKKNKGNSKHLDQLSSIKPFRRELDTELKKPWLFEQESDEITNMLDSKKNIIWRGELLDGKQWNGFGIYEIEGDQILIYEGILCEENFDGEGKLTTYFKNLDEKNQIEKVVATTKLFYDKKNKKSKGKLFENGKEYSIEFKNGIFVPDSKKRTFEGLRLMFIGNVGVGKTFLRKRFLGMSSIEENKKIQKTLSMSLDKPTQGVEILRWKNNKENILFSIWDFSGHEEYHVVHSFFFSSGSVYLLVFDCSLPLHEVISKNKLLYWFHFLQSQAGKDASVILIGTKVDLLQKDFWFYEKDKLKERLLSINNEIEKLIEENHLYLKFHKFNYGDTNKTIFEKTTLLFNPINTKELNIEKSGISTIYNLLSDMYQHVSHNVITTVSHKIVFSAIEKISGKNCEDSIDQIIVEKKDDSPFVQLNLVIEELERKKDENKDEKNEIQDAIENIGNILVDLNNLGVIVYRDNHNLKDTIIVDPQWFNSVFKVIFDSGKKKLQIVLNKIFQEILKFENNAILKNNEFKSPSKILVSDLINFIRGDANPNLSISEIWSNSVEKNKSNVENITFDELSEKTRVLQHQMNLEGLNGIFDIFRKEKHNDILQSFYSINEDKISPIISDILGPKYSNDNDKKKYLFLMLKKLEFFLPTGSKVIETNNRYLIPLLFPKTRPYECLLASGEDFSDSKRVHEWILRYNIPFKPPSLWKILFLKLRRECVGSEEKMIMIDEIYWFGGFIFNYNRIVSNKQSILIELDLIENERISIPSKNISINNSINNEKIKKTHQKRDLAYTIKVIIKSDDDPSVIFNSLDKIISKFIKKWDLNPICDITRKFISPTITNSLKSHPICSVCSVLIAVNDKLKMCENCTSKSFLSNHFLLYQIVANTPFGRVFKASHKSSGITVAIKERTVETENSYKLSQKEIKKSKLIENIIPSLTTSRLVCVLDDKLRKIKNRYIIFEWVQGGNLVGFKSSKLQQSTFKTEREFVRMALMLLNELKKLHSKGIIHRDIKTDSIMWTEKEGIPYYMFVGFTTCSTVEDPKLDYSIIEEKKESKEKSEGNKSEEDEKENKSDEKEEKEIIENNQNVTPKDHKMKIKPYDNNDISLNLTPITPVNNQSHISENGMDLSQVFSSEKQDLSSYLNSTLKIIEDKSFKNDIYSMGMTLKEVLFSTKIKYTDKIFELISNMTNQSAEERYTVDDCIDYLMKICEICNYNHMDIFVALKKENQFIIPPICDIEKIRNITSNSIDFLSTSGSLGGSSKLLEFSLKELKISSPIEKPKLDSRKHYILKNNLGDSPSGSRQVVHPSIIIEEKERIIKNRQEIIKNKEEQLKSKDNQIEELLKEIEELKKRN